MSFFRKIIPSIKIEPDSSEAKSWMLEQVLFALQDGLIIYTQDFKINFINPAAESMLGVHKEKVLGKTISPQDIRSSEFKLLVQVLFPSLAPVMTAVSESGKYPQIVDLSFEDPFLEFRVMTAPLQTKEGETMFMKLIHDRTRELTILRSKNEFITVASHQLRSPLTNIIWGLEALAGDDTLSETAREIANKAYEAGRQLLSTVEDLLAIARIEEGRYGYVYEPVDIVKFVGDFLAEIYPRAAKLGMKLYFDKTAETLNPVMIDPRKMKIVLENLLDNALRYNVAGGEVTVRVEQLPGKPFVRVSVKDTGIGFSEKDAQKIFTKFFRAENALKAQTDGSGLGLYIVKNIIRSHGGEIAFESELNRGSTFYFTLPTDPSLVPKKEIPLEY